MGSGGLFAQLAAPQMPRQFLPLAPRSNSLPNIHFGSGPAFARDWMDLDPGILPFERCARWKATTIKIAPGPLA